MFTPIHTDHPATLGFDAKGRITADDYRSTLIPALEDAAARHGKAGMLVRFGPEFEGYEVGAMAEDALFGLRHMNAFGRIAVASDVTWIRHGMAFFAHLVPMPVKLFGATETGQALAWLATEQTDG